MADESAIKATSFAITTSTGTVRLDPKTRKGNVAFTVTNTSGKPLRATAKLVAQGATADWLNMDGEIDRDFPINGTQLYSVQVNVPTSAAAGTQGFQLDVIGVALPDEVFGIGPRVDVVVPEPPIATPTPQIPWLPIGIAAAIVALLIIGLATFLLTRTTPAPPPAPTPTPLPKATGSPRPDLAGARIRAPGAPEIYLVDDNGTRRWIPDPSTYNNLFRDGSAIQAIDVSGIATGPDITRGAYLAIDDRKAVYLIDNEQKRLVASPAVMDKFSFDWGKVRPVPQRTIDAMPSGAPLQ